MRVKSFVRERKGRKEKEGEGEEEGEEEVDKTGVFHCEDSRLTGTLTYVC